MKKLCALAVLLGLLTLAAGANAVTLVKEGKPTAVIVLPANASSMEKKCASELQKYIEKMSGALLPVSDKADSGITQILIGRNPESLKLVGDIFDEEHLGYDGIILKTIGNKLIILGKDGKGQLYAGYDFLNRLGCRFYLPHPDGEIIPSKKTISIDGLNHVHKPDFIKRNYWNNGYVRPYLAHPEWYSSWSDKNYLGGVDLLHNHIYLYVCPKDKYFSAHPEYFPLVEKNGKMVRTPGGQLCLSNPDLVKMFADAAIAAFDKKPDLKAFSLSPNDTKGWCQCEKCKSMDSPDPDVGLAWRVLKFNNEVAEIVSKKYPDKWLAYYAEYMNLPGPPVGMKAHPMIMPIIVNRYDIMHNIHDPYMGDTSKTGIHYNPDYIRLFNTWKDIAEQFGVREWYQLGKPPQLPAPMLYSIGDRIRFYKKHETAEFDGEVIGRSPVNDITMYIGSRLIWDSNQDERAMLDEFFKLYFAEASGPMREYYRQLHEPSYFSNDNRGCYIPRNSWSPNLIARLYKTLNWADSVAKQDVVRRRLDRERKSLRVTELCAEAFSQADLWFDEKHHPAKEKALEIISQADSYLDSISEEDIVASHRMKMFLEQLRKQLGPAKAKPKDPNAPLEP